MSFGRRLALFFVLIVLVPTLALVGMLIIVSEDSRQGKADARLAAGLDTALALYDEKVAAAEPSARPWPTIPSSARACERGMAPSSSGSLARLPPHPGVEGVEVLGPAGTIEAAAGDPDAIAFAQLDLEDGERAGAAAGLGDDRAGVRGGGEAADQARAGGQLRRTACGHGRAADHGVEPGETTDLELRAGRVPGAPAEPERRARDRCCCSGPRKDEGLLAIERPVAALLAGFLLLAHRLAYVLARTLDRAAHPGRPAGGHGPAHRALEPPPHGPALRREVERAQRFGHELSLLIVDADDFKQINDEHGHSSGTRCWRRSRT